MSQWNLGQSGRSWMYLCIMSGPCPRFMFREHSIIGPRLPAFRNCRTGGARVLRQTFSVGQGTHRPLVNYGSSSLLRKSSRA